MTNTLGWRMKCALLSALQDTVMQPEYDAMRPHGVTNHTYRLEIRPPAWTSDANFSQAVGQADAAVEAAVSAAMACEPAHIILGPSLESVWVGGQAAGLAATKVLSERIRRLAGGTVGVTVAAEAIQAALKAFGIAKHVGLVTPYRPPGVPHVIGFLEEMGYRVVGQKHLPPPTPTQMAETPESVLREAFQIAAQGDAEAVVQFGANLPSMRVAAESERWLGKPVITVNVASYWHALRQHGIHDRIYGCGRLLEMF